MSFQLLVTGASGFTGRHFCAEAKAAGMQVVELQASLNDLAALKDELAGRAFDYVVHLAGISAVTHADEEAFYRVNLFGSLNLMKALLDSGHIPRKILVASSANVYGNSDLSPISETTAPHPVNHYAMSKLALEHMLGRYSGDLPIVITRPFNYTGVGHDNRFVIPKIVASFSARQKVLQLGNITVEREFNDVRDVVEIYLQLLAAGEAGETYNICSGRPHSLSELLTLMQEITGHNPRVDLNPDFVRANELQTLYGDRSKLTACIGQRNYRTLRETLSWMLDAHG